jgi:hypothetical protein
MNLEERTKEFFDKIWTIGNHQEERCNELLSESKQISEMEMSLEKRVEIMCWQFWIVGNMSGQKLTVKEGNRITSKLLI